MFNGFMDGWWRMDNYSKRRHFFWLMPVIAVMAVFTAIARRLSK